MSVRKEAGRMHAADALSGTGPAGPTAAPDLNQGFRPPFAVDLYDLGSPRTVAVLADLPSAAREASRLARKHGAWKVEITDQDRISI